MKKTICLVLTILVVLLMAMATVAQAEEADGSDIRDLVIRFLSDSPAQERKVVMDNGTLYGLFDADGKASTLGFFEIGKGSWYLGTLEKNSCTGFGMRVGPSADGTDQEEVAFGFFKDGMLQGDCILYYEDGSRLMGAFKDNKREGQCDYVAADGVRYQCLYENDEQVSFEKVGTAEVKYIAQVEFGDEAAVATITEDEQLAGGHVMLCDGKSWLYIGGYEMEMFCGNGMMAIKDEEQALHTYIGFWDFDRLTGDGLYIAPDGTRIPARWEDGELVDSSLDIPPISIGM